MKGRFCMIEIKEIKSAAEKSKICGTILRSLPNWFGVEASIVDYMDKATGMPFYSAKDEDGNAVGFVALKIHSEYAAEVCVMGILGEYHRQGIGRKLIKLCESFCMENKIEFLTVKTLAESRESESYGKTRLFYQSMGFRPLEVFPLLWDEDNPCLFMVKVVRCEGA